MCTSLLGILKINCPSEKSTNTINISMQVLNQKISETVANVNQESRSSYTLVQNQRVILNNYPTYGIVPDLKILQEAKLNLVDKTTLMSTIKSEDMTSLSNNISTQFDDLLKDNSNPFVVKNKDNIVNLRNSITNVIKSSSTLKSAQKAISESLSVQSQEIIINFGPGVPDAVLSEMGADIQRVEGQRPIIQIDQKLVNNILKNAVISSVISSIKNDAVVNTALAKFGNNVDCEMTFTEDPCNVETKKTNLRGKVTTESKGEGIKCLNFAQKKFPSVNWRTTSPSDYIAIYPCTIKDEDTPKTDIEKEIENELQDGKEEPKSDLEKQIEEDIKKDTSEIKEQIKPSPDNTKPVEKQDKEKLNPVVEEKEKSITTKESETKDNTMMFVGIGVGIVIIAGIVYFMKKK